MTHVIAHKHCAALHKRHGLAVKTLGRTPGRTPQHGFGRRTNNAHAALDLFERDMTVTEPERVPLRVVAVKQPPATEHHPLLAYLIEQFRRIQGRRQCHPQEQPPAGCVHTVSAGKSSASRRSIRSRRAR